MEARRGSVLFFLTVLLYLAGVCVQSQDTPTSSTTVQNNVTSAAPNATSTNNTTATPAPTDSSVAGSTNTTSSVPGGNSAEPTTTGNTTSSTPTSTPNMTTNTQTVPTVTNVTSTPPTTVESTTTTNYCASLPCINGNCTNTASRHFCTCEPGWTDDNCGSELVLWPDYNSSKPTTANTTTELSSVPFAYFDRASTVLNVNTRGYVSFGENFISANTPEGTAWPYTPDLFAIYWSDIEILNNGSSLFYASKIERTTSSDMNSSSLIQYVKDVVNVSNFEPLYLIVATWVDAMPRPAANFSNDKATFQLILASDTKFSYAIRNYQTVWGNLGKFGRPRVSAAYTAENGSKQSLNGLQNTTGKLVTQLFTSGTPNKNPFDCVQNTLDVNSTLNDSVRSLPNCPCYVSQVKVDGWFESVNASSPCYQSVLSVKPGLKQQCCYNRFGLLIVNSSEASVPLQVNTSGITLQMAQRQCCSVVPQLCPWFYNRFPSSDCRLYSPPYIGISFGKTYTVTFDNNKYSFNGLGDFVLFKSGEVEVQMKTRINVGTNTTSIEALAVKTADNTSSFQIYVNMSVLTWNFTTTPATRPENNAYIIKTSQPDVTLWLPTAIVTVTQMNDSLSCSIKVNKKDSNSRGILGSADGSPTNDLMNKNGTSLNNTADNLSIDIINEFALSWQVRNATESLFDYPSLPANESANTTTKFTPSLMTANVAAAMKLFNNSVAAQVQELCGSELFCVQEYNTSNSNMSATAVFQQANSISALKAQSTVNAPVFANTDTQIIILNNGSSLFTLNLQVQNGMNVTFSDETSFPNISGTRLENSTFTWNISADLMVLRTLLYPRTLKFYATNEANVSAEYTPTISLCLCEQASQCQMTSYADGRMIQYSLTSDRIANGNVNIMLCGCGDRAGGKFCEMSVDFCSNCYDNSTCNATKLTDYCGPCPSGYEGDGKHCIDIDECSHQNGGCDQICTNSPGSFQCSCNSGYTKNETRCIDIDECLQDVNICQDRLKMCINSEGSYSCFCFPTLIGDKCIRAPFAYVGNVALANTGDQAWNTSLKDNKSSYYKQLSEKVSRSITAKLDEGNVGTSDTRLVKVLSFAQAENATRTKRQATTSNSPVTATFVIYLANNTITADTINTLLREGNATDCTGSCQYKELIIITYPQVDSKANLCSYSDIHKCDLSTTTCVQSEQATSCKCKPGFDNSHSDTYSCRDTDECAENATKFCPDTGVCINSPPGSYMCSCSEGHYWDENNKTCAADGCADKPCKNGACYPLKNPSDFTCKCNSGWEGRICDNEDAEAHRLKVAVICVSVILGVFCLVLLIILIVICVRQHRTLENDSYTNSRYSEAEHLPRVKIANRAGTEMSENGQSNTYARLNSGSDSGDKSTFFGQHAPTPDSRGNVSKGVYQNRAYEEDVGERL